MPRYDYSSLDEAVEEGEGVERPFKCHMHDDSSASASVNVDKGVWYCFSCFASGRVDRKGRTFTSEMKQTLAAFAEGGEYAKHQVGWLDIFDGQQTHPYWEERFGKDICRKHRLGIHPMTGNPCYPMIGPDKMVHGIVQRTFGAPKYLYPSGVPVSRMMYGFTKRKVRTVLVVEGAADAISVSSALSGVRSTMVVAAYGAGLHRPQVDLINSIGPTTVLLGFDDDKAGDRAKARSYPLNAEVKSIAWGAKDPGECSMEEIRRAVTRRNFQVAGEVSA